MRIIETHCHLDYLKDRPLEETLRLAREAGVEKIVTIGVDPDNLDGVQALAETHAEVYFTQGIHPHDSKDGTDVEWQKILERCQHPKMVAVGEIGLDYHYNNSPPEIQRVVFRRQLEIAVATEKPVVIHSRDADEDMAAVLKEFAPQLKRKGVVHSFSSGLGLARTALDLGFYLGFNGIITFPKAENVRDAVRLCPLEQMLVETDSPFLTPVPHRGKENAPHQLPHILAKLAELKGTHIDRVSEITLQNAQMLFRI
jgi:TatD DNase family protein